VLFSRENALFIRAIKFHPILVFPACAAILCASWTACAQPAAPASPRNPKPKYPVPYPPAEVADIKAVLERELAYLETASPVKVVDTDTQAEVTDLSHLPKHVALQQGDFGIVGYEWGVTYAGMLQAAEATGDPRFKEFVSKRLEAIRALAAHLETLPLADRGQTNSLSRLLEPSALDHCGAMCAGLLKAQQAGVGVYQPIFNIGLDYISAKQLRLADGTLARNRPVPNCVWLDDVYMSVPALAQMGKFTGDQKYYDDAAKQVLQFAKILFDKDKGIYLHGMAMDMQDHPQFHWGRANGWAAMAEVELLSVLPEKHPGFAPVLAQLRAHMRGLANAQGINGLWHQLLDRPETYEETSASAMFVFAGARAINRGWIDAAAYGPMVSVGWNALAKKVNDQGQVEGTCVGTGLTWDPMFYAYQPTSVYAAHGYGPMLLAGSEMIALRQGKGAGAGIHDGGLHFVKPDTEPQ
jgi:rhamnogalacturonyl hydrolase YesR